MSGSPGRGFVRFLLSWHGVPGGRCGRAGLLRTVGQLQDIPVPFSELEDALLPARLTDYSSTDLDELFRAEELVWQGDSALGQHDGRLRLYLRREFPLLGRISVFAPGSRERLLRDLLAAEPGLSFEQILARVGGFPDDILKTLWRLAWNGEASCDSLAAMRARRSATASRTHRRPRPRYTARKRLPPGAGGRWFLLTSPEAGFAAGPERELAAAGQLVDRLGIVCPQTLAGQECRFEALRGTLEQLEAGGRAARVCLLDTGGGPQFAAPGAEAVWRAAQAEPPCGVFAASDPASAFGAAAAWPRMAKGYRPARSPGARVLIHDGRLAGYLARDCTLHTPDAAPRPDIVMRLLHRLAAHRPVHIASVDGEPPYRTPWHTELTAAGFSPSRRGYLLRRADPPGRA